ncbi:hypothetical protein CVE36_13325, partial [Pseudomonas syringae pv. actinidiae]|nr:hypothetical protein [Pseudomonas syringae pv. actinidiae]
GPSGKQLVAYLVPTDVDRDPDVLREALKTHLKAHVPDYMVPTYVVFIDVMPLTANGKLDRRALPKPDVSQSQQGYVAPRTEFEQRFGGAVGAGVAGRAGRSERQLLRAGRALATGSFAGGEDSRDVRDIHQAA